MCAKTKEIILDIDRKTLNKMVVKTAKETEDAKEVEYYFISKTLDEAKKLAEYIKADLGYSVTFCKRSFPYAREFTIEGWTQEMPMDDDFMDNWVKEMDKVAEKFNCLFGGWGCMLI